jgi:hypothetical protein
MNALRKNLRPLVCGVLLLLSLFPLLRSVKAQQQSAVESRKVAGLVRLHEMVCEIRLGMSREEVEQLLGKPTYSPTKGQFNYAVDAWDEKGIPFGLVVEYRRLAYREGEVEKYTGKVEEYWVGRIAE